MNVRVFLLIAATALFGGLWTSDQQYQERELAVARAARAHSAPRTLRSDKSRTNREKHSGSFFFSAGVVPLAGDRTDKSDERARRITVSWTLAEGIQCVNRCFTQARSQMEEELCWARWRMRRELFYTQRRLTVLLRKPTRWDDILVDIVRQAARQLETPPKRAAAVEAGDARR